MFSKRLTRRACAPEKQQQRRKVKEDAMTGKEKKREVNEKRKEKERKKCKG
jgi:hypothetical protein